MTKIERIRAVLNRASVDYVPTGFWIHFTEDCFFGDAAVNAHLEFFDKTESDLCKVMDETAVKDYIIVCRELFERTTVDGIRIMPWTIFLDKLWNNEIFS